MNRMQWNYQKIEYFLKAAETLNFSKAARELYLSPQSLNKQILQLEKELGEPLFARTTRQVELTPFGQRMQQAFLPAREEFERAQGVIERYLESRKRTVRIAFFQAISKQEVVAPVTNYLKACEKGLQAELLGGEIDEVIQWLQQGKCDLIITNIHDYEVWEDVEIIPFATSPAKITVSLYHPWMVKEKITLQDLEEMPILLLERKKKLEENSFYRNVKAKERLYAPNFSSFLATLEMGGCYAVFPELFESKDRMGLRYLDLPEECLFQFHMSAIYRKDNPMAELLSSLKNLAEEGMIHIT